jgi:hypothetical protein
MFGGQWLGNGIEMGDRGLIWGIIPIFSAMNCWNPWNVQAWWPTSGSGLSNTKYQNWIFDCDVPSLSNWNFKTAYCSSSPKNASCLIFVRVRVERQVDKGTPSRRRFRRQQSVSQGVQKFISALRSASQLNPLSARWIEFSPNVCDSSAT